MRRMGAQKPDGPPQGSGWAIGGDVRRARRLDHRACVTLMGRDLDGQDAPTPLADGAAALRHRRLAILDALTTWPM